MMAEPTLGQRILDAAMRWAFDRALCGIEVGRESEDQLRALAARADAAERLAVAGDREVATRDALNAALERMYADPDKGRDMDTEEEAATYEAACNEYDEALAAWRAINGEVDG